MIALGLASMRPRPTPETRSYTSQILNAVEVQAAGASGTAIGTAAVETASGLWGRALALAEVSPVTRRTAALTPSLLAMVGRALCRYGQIVFDIEVDSGALRLLPASAAYVVVGSGDPRTWIYTVTVDGPGNTRTVHRTRDGVVHLQYAVSPSRPWEGRAPWATAGLSGTLLAGIERQLSGEAGGASGYILPTPDVGDKGEAAPDPANPSADDGEADPLTTLRRDLAAAAGATVLAPTTAAGYGAGPGAAPGKDYHPERFGFNPPSTALEGRRDVERSILAACGVPPALANHAAPGTSLRESVRLFAAVTMAPIARMIAQRLSESLGQQIELTLPNGNDPSTMARSMMAKAQAVQMLVTAGMSIADAREAVGL